MRSVEVFADVLCPSTHVGLAPIRRRIATVGADVVLRARAWPLELVNDAPIDPNMGAGKIEVLRRTVAPELFAGFDPTRFPTTSLPAMALGAAAYRVDDTTGQRASLRVRDAPFRGRLRHRRPQVLADLASSLGVHDPSIGSGDVLADGRR
jgi:predicted DsbA family dithiol-disulfide isomerase